MSNTPSTNAIVPIIDPEVKSLLTTFLGYAATGLATWATGIGIVPNADRASFINIVVAAVLWLIAAAIGWYKKKANSKDSMIKAVNAVQNGVKVVASDGPGAVVNKALK